MARVLNEYEQSIYLENREFLHEQLRELQADLLDMTDEELLDCRGILLERINWCMSAILETDEDNLGE